MLNIYTARECIDKEKYIYDKVSQDLAKNLEVLVIVPKQYTLVAEEQALKYLNASCLFNVEIMSLDRLGTRVLTEKGREALTMLSQYGRLMLMTKIINNRKDDLHLFASAATKRGFAALLTDFIKDFKQQECKADALAEMIADESVNPILKSKLSELSGIVEDYEESLKGVYTDNEDFVKMYAEEIATSNFIKGKKIYIYGYDSITPNVAETIAKLSAAAEDVEIYLCESDYGLEYGVSSLLKNACESTGVGVKTEHLFDENYLKQKNEMLAAVEKYAFKGALTDEERDFCKNLDCSALEIIQCANPHYEAESIAAKIYELVRDEGYRLRDIAIICNNKEILQPLIQRTLVEYGIPCFLDSTRGIRESSCVSFIEHLLACLARGWKTEWIMSMLKSGLSDFSDEEVYELDNYTREYKIHDSMWERPFKYHRKDITDETFSRIENNRQKLMSLLLKAKEIQAESENVAAFIDSLKAYFEDAWDLQNKNEKLAENQDTAGYAEEGMKTRQSLEEAYDLLDQMKEIMGECKLEPTDFYEIYAAGLETAEVGVLPSSIDGVSMGPTARTRPRPAKAVLLAGVNEGTLPLEASPEGLFSVEEKKYFESAGFAIGGIDSLRALDENVSIYRIMSLPTEKIIMTYSITDSEGGSLRQSSLIDNIMSVFPRLKPRLDIVSRGWDLDLINERRSALRYLINRIKSRDLDENYDVLLKALLEWYKTNEGDALDIMKRLSLYENEAEPLGRELSAKLFARKNGEFILSASSLDRYAKCPYSYFIERGLSPHEERGFEADPRSIGDIYHNCLMKVGTILKAKGGTMEENFNIGDEELEKIIHEAILELAATSEQGLFLSTGAEKYRLGRIEEICFAAAKAMLLQLGSGGVEDVFFEEDFGRGKTFEPVELKVYDQTVYVEGRIDRVDFMKSNKVRVIDYKTGSKTFNPDEISRGINMQLMIYMLSLTGKREPAGMYYFHIKDPIDAFPSSKPEEPVPLERRFPLKGKYIDDDSIYEMMPPEALSIKPGKHSSRCIKVENYNELAENVKDRVKELAESLMKGEIQIRPLRINKKLEGCSFCKFKSICKYDYSYFGNKPRDLKSLPKNNEN